MNGTHRANRWTSVIGVGALVAYLASAHAATPPPPARASASASAKVVRTSLAARVRKTIVIGLAAAACVVAAGCAGRQGPVYGQLTTRAQSERAFVAGVTYWSTMRGQAAPPAYGLWTASDYAYYRNALHDRKEHLQDKLRSPDEQDELNKIYELERLDRYGRTR